MKKLLLIWTLIVTMVMVAIAQTEKTLIKTFNIDEDCNFIVFALQGNTDVEHWDKETVRIVTRINTPEITEKALETLVKNGRYTYQVELHEEERVLIIDLPKTEKQVIINDMDLYEEMDFKIFLPQNMRYKVVNPNTPPPAVM